MLLAACTAQGVPESEAETLGIVESASTGACHKLDNTAAPATLREIPAAKPAPTGGKLLPGLYHLTEVLRYTGEGGTARSFPIPIRVTGRNKFPEPGGNATLAEVVVDEPNAHIEFTANLSYPGGGALEAARTCPSPGPLPFDGYDGDETSFRFHITATGEIRVFTKVTEGD